MGYVYFPIILAGCVPASTIYLFHTPVCLYVCLSVRRSVCLSACLSVFLSACLSVCLSVCLSLCLSACLSVCLPVCLSACLPACLSVCLSVCLSASLLCTVCRGPSSRIATPVRHQLDVNRSGRAWANAWDLGRRTLLGVDHCCCAFGVVFLVLRDLNVLRRFYPANANGLRHV